MLQSQLCELLGIKYPVFQGGMAWISDASLAAAVSNAGGLGIIAGMNSNREQLTAEIEKLRTMTDKPFGVNVMLMSPFVKEVAQVVIDQKVPVVVTGAGDPSPYMKAWLDAGIKVIPVVASVSFAKRAERNGATAVIAEGAESGGHIGKLHTMPLIPQIVDAVKIPVLAAGGIADGRGMAAALMLGACGVQMGTRFLVADECTIHDNYKDMVLKAKDIDTITTGERTGDACRALKNPFSKDFHKKEMVECLPAEELAPLGIGALRRAAREGDTQTGSFLCGEIAGLVNERMSCAQIIEEVCGDCEKLLMGASKWVK